jgi:hypothetical protein
MATATVQLLRQNGIRKMDDLLRAALLDPEIARSLMVKATPGNWRFAQMSLQARFKRALGSGAAASSQSNVSAGHSRRLPMPPKVPGVVAIPPLPARRLFSGTAP